MRIQFCGADRTVTGSCHLVEINGLKIILDMGMYQGPRQQAADFNSWLPDDATKADALILSHGHLDHCGKIPVLSRNGYHGPIYCTAATADVARIVLEDAAEIQEEDAAYLNRRERAPGSEPIRPLYVRADVPKVLKQMQRTPYDQRIDLGRGVGFTFHDAGHILGSAYVTLDWQENGKNRSLLFTGDVGRYSSPIIRDPVDPPPADYVITESTYGGRPHAPIAEVGPQLLEAVRYCISRKSRLLVPAYAVGRTQIVLWYMQRFIQENLIPPIPIYVDSPMGIEITEVHSRYRDNYDQETREAIGTKDLFGASRVTFARSIQESKRINSDHGPCVIIASSPTCEFGRILHHLTQSIERPADQVLMVGWIPPHTLGRRLQDGQKRVKIYDRWYDVQCQVVTIHGLSAHADGEELVRFLKPAVQRETTLYIVHGEPDQAAALAYKALELGAYRVTVPALDTEVLA